MLVGPERAPRFLGHSYMGRMHQPPFPLGRSPQEAFREHILIGRARRRRASSVSPPAGSPRWPDANPPLYSALSCPNAPPLFSLAISFHFHVKCSASLVIATTSAYTTSFSTYGVSQSTCFPVSFLVLMLKFVPLFAIYIYSLEFPSHDFLRQI